MATTGIVRRATTKFRARIEARIADGNLTIEDLVDMVVEQESRSFMERSDFEVVALLSEWAMDDGRKVVDPMGWVPPR